MWRRLIIFFNSGFSGWSQRRAGQPQRPLFMYEIYIYILLALNDFARIFNEKNWNRLPSNTHLDVGSVNSFEMAVAACWVLHYIPRSPQPDIRPGSCYNRPSTRDYWQRPAPGTSPGNSMSQPLKLNDCYIISHRTNNINEAAFLSAFLLCLRIRHGHLPGEGTEVFFADFFFVPASACCITITGSAPPRSYWHSNPKMNLE